MIIKKYQQRNATAPREGKSPSLLLFFAGWGMDERPFQAYLPKDRDCWICYDYRSLAFDYSAVMEYAEVQVVAWSMGVWAASYILRDNPFPVSESIAINGTPYPVHDEKGIAERIFQGTLDGLNEQTLQKFRRRMCGTAEALNRFLAQIPQRSIEDLREELRLIGERSKQPLPSAFRWDKAYIGKNDKIFLPANQQKAWEGTATVLNLIDSEHYPEEWFKGMKNGK